MESVVHDSKRRRRTLEDVHGAYTHRSSSEHGRQELPTPTRTRTPQRSKQRRRRRLGVGFTCGLIATQITAAAAQSCISLADSTTCPSFNASSISTNSNFTGLFPFLSSVTDTASFDSAIQTYIANGFTEQRYQQLIGCSNVNLDNTTAFYARYTTSVLCNAIVQNSLTPCDLTGDATRPLCADSCGEYAQSEQEIVASDICGNAGDGALTQIRADFTNCALPADSLTKTCIPAAYNEPENCGYGSNLGSLCSYCASSSQNATDSCCVFSNTTTRCEGVVLPVIASSALNEVVTTMVTTSPGSTSTSGSTGATTSNSRSGLSGGAIAGIVIGAVLGALALLALIIFGCLLFRRRRASSPATSVFNQPATMRQMDPPSTGYTDGTVDRNREGERAGLAVLPGGRVTRMSALEGSSSSSQHSQSPMLLGGARRSGSSDRERAMTPHGTLLSPPQTAGKRSGSLSSGSQFASAAAAARAFADETSPSSGEDYTSPESAARSEQLAFFKDYYSSDEVHGGDLVATLWTYEPRAADEFHLERGDMVKVTGIWDDGWATGVRVRMKAEDWRPQRDSGMTTGSSSGESGRLGSPEGEGEVKAFPMVCVCLPQHWRKTIEGDSTEGSGPY
ncbi:hypothetical protein B0A48_04892 [Cryoendolithus antarcticus]|uniref:SH3 domain-containing protein n=1 Tax=Cryoendolithus antarcticus TaxID=1507870 RepID=A0A1V8TE04_9PEZI|nr:hypothetical protein B0A48_04892 [Cryoendolithus antarcticus]